MSDIELEGKISQVHEKESYTTKAGKLTFKQLIIMSVKGKSTRITCYSMEEMSKYRDKVIRMSGLSESFKKDGSYMANAYASEIDDRVDTDITDDEHLAYGVKDGVGAYNTEEYKDDGKLKDHLKPNVDAKKTNPELSKYSITVTRSKDFQSITLAEEFTGSFAEIDVYWSALDEKAKSLLLRMPKL